MARCGAQFYCFVLMAAVVIFCGCAQNGNEQEPELVTERLVYACDSMRLWLCSKEWHDIVLSECDPSALLVGSLWRVPTYDEGVLLHDCDVEVGSEHRYLCVSVSESESESEVVWYSFLFGGVGKITKAGTRTKYTLRPVRSVVIPKDTIILL